MPPKVDKGQQKAAEKAKAKIVEDKTFGLKNKNKSKSVQKYIKSVQAQVHGGRVKSEHEIKQEQKEKAEARKRQKEALLASLAKTQKEMKAAAGGESKVLESQKAIDIYSDPRERKAAETMDDWDQAKLEEVVKTKHGGHQATTEIVCRYFLDALERRLYGWFWQCPNGEKCQYRHALPAGYVLKPKDPSAQAEADEEEEEPLEELIERERAMLPAGGTPVTLETFTAWKKRQEEKAAAAREEAAKQEAETRSGGAGGRLDMSGRALFSFDPKLFLDAVADGGDGGGDDWLQKYRAETQAEEERLEAEQEARTKAQEAAERAEEEAAAEQARQAQQTHDNDHNNKQTDQQEGETAASVGAINKRLFLEQADDEAALLDEDLLDDE